MFKWRRRERGDAVRNFVGPGRAAARRYDLVDERPRPWQFGPDVAVLGAAPSSLILVLTTSRDARITGSVQDRQLVCSFQPCGERLFIDPGEEFFMQDID